VREETCPFCGARVARERAPKPRSFGHATRAVLAFGAAAATASAAPISACGGESSSSPGDASSQEAASTSDARDHVAPDASFGNSPGVPSYGGCPFMVGTPPAWKAPAPAPGACSAADMSAFASKADDPAATFKDLYAAVSSTCEQCLFSDQAGATWQPVVWSPDMASNMAFINFGACYAVVGSAACGKAVQDDQYCLTSACSGECPDNQGCTAAAAMGDCYMYETAQKNVCGSNTHSLDAMCGKFLDAVNVVCGSGPSDGGSAEGGADSGSD
jgi:hypothetical protein